ncbi:MAG TPA: glycoside hydrolase family 2 TIM barrel-domain containing protein [Bryobacteraceae bacterium]|nr:glycoside hydrolase family 2 TIM barrel-domain containing protein [Bryobacteraceae bacterium]
MKLFCTLLLLGWVAAAEERVPLNGGWMFAAVQAQENDLPPESTRWTPVQVPHCWPVNLPSPAGRAGWFRRDFAAPARANSHVRIVFDAVFHKTKVWLNGRYAGDHEGADMPWELDIDPYLQPGNNTVMVSAEAALAVRDVWLLVTPRVYPQSLRVVATRADVTGTVWIRNTLENTVNVQVEFSVLEGTRVLARSTAAGTIPPGLTQDLDTTLHIPNAKLWSIDQPHLYELRTVVFKSAEALEGAYESEIRSHFGIRTVAVRGTELLLNGEPIRLAGVNRGIDPPEFCAIESDAALDADFRLMKEAGLEFQLVGQHPARAHLLDWADRNGMLLIMPVASADRAKIRQLIEQHGNHPSIIAWSTEDTCAAAPLVKSLDSTRVATGTCPAAADIVSFAHRGDTVSLEKTVEQMHSRYPGKPLFLSEFGPPPEAPGAARDAAAFLHRAAAVFRMYSYVAGAALTAFHDAPSLYNEAVRNEFSVLKIQQVSQEHGVTMIEIANRAGFPHRTARGYQLRVGNQTQPIPELEPGGRAKFEFHSVNPYRVDIVTGTGFVVADR